MLLQGLTPLHTAVNHGHPDLVEILLSHGARVNATNRQASQFLSDAVANQGSYLDDKLNIYGRYARHGFV